MWKIENRQIVWLVYEKLKGDRKTGDIIEIYAKNPLV